MTSKFKGYLCGVLTTSAVTCLFQDYLGKDGYIEHIQSYWIDSSIGVPVALFSLFAAAMLYNENSE